MLEKWLKKERPATSCSLREFKLARLRQNVNISRLSLLEFVFGDINVIYIALEIVVFIFHIKRDCPICSCSCARAKKECAYVLLTVHM